jgi:hypothetical protein
MKTIPILIQHVFASLRVILLALVFLTGHFTGRLLAGRPANMEEAHECLLFVQTYSANGKALARGTAFVAQDGDTQWIFTNAHVIEGAKRIEFTAKDGSKLKEFGRFQCFSKQSGGGAHGDSRFGGDGIRLELKKPRTFALGISAQPQRFTKGAKVITIGDNTGDLSMNVSHGDVTAASKMIIQSTCKTEPGSSGGALLDPESFEVVGLNTFGISGKVKLTDAIWQQGVDERVAGAAILDSVTWIDMNAANFLNGSDVAMRFRDTVRMLALIYTLVPQEGGFKIDLNNRFAANLTFEQAFNRFKNDPVFRPVVGLNQRLAGRGGNIGVNNMELVKIYANALTEIRDSYRKQREVLTAALPPYFLIDFEESGFYEVGDWCHLGLADAQVWFQQKSKLGGTMPVGCWLNLKPLSELGK